MKWLRIVSFALLQQSPHADTTHQYHHHDTTDQPDEVTWGFGCYNASRRGITSTPAKKLTQVVGPPKRHSSSLGRGEHGDVPMVTPRLCHHRRHLRQHHLRSPCRRH